MQSDAFKLAENSSKPFKICKFKCTKKTNTERGWKKGNDIVSIEMATILITPSKYIV